MKSINNKNPRLVFNKVDGYIKESKKLKIKLKQ